MTVQDTEKEATMTTEEIMSESALSTIETAIPAETRGIPGIITTIGEKAVTGRILTEETAHTIKEKEAEEKGKGKGETRSTMRFLADRQ